MTAATATRTRGNGGTGTRRIVGHVVLIAVALVMLYPLLWMIGASLKPESQIFTGTGLWPHVAQWANYVTGWRGFGVSFDVFFENSIFIAIANVLGNVLSCSLAAYAFARLDFPLKRL